MSSPIYVNLYWDASWDVDNPTMPTAALDSLTAAVLSTSYFGGLAEYGVGMPTYGGGFLPDRGCSQKPPPRVLFYNPGYASIIGFLNCELQHASSSSLPTGSQVVYNIILPNGTLEADLPPWATAFHFHQTPYTTLGAAAVGVGLLATYVGAGAGDLVAFLLALGAAQDGPLYTIETADMREGVLTDNLIEEMVEAATNPYLTSIDGISNEIVDVAKNKKNMCSDTHPFVPPTPPSPFISMLGGFTNSTTLSVPQYWSNARQACSATFTSMVTPTITGVTPHLISINNGLQNFTFTINGSGFGTLPSSTSLPATLLPYIALQDDTQHWQAENALNNNGRSFTITSWADNQISFVGAALGGPWPGDSFSFWVCNPLSGNCAWGVFPPTITTVSPSTVQCGATPNGTLVSLTGSDFYKVVDVKLDNSVVDSNPTVTSLSQMTAMIPASAFTSAGSHLLTVDALGGSSAGQGQTSTFSVAPTVTRVAPNSGGIAGGTAVKIGGACLDRGTGVFFGSTPAYASCTGQGCDAVSPPSSTVGPVDVIASSGSPPVSSATNPTFDRFFYLAPTITSISPSTGPSTGGTSVTLTGANFPLYGRGQTMGVSFVAIPRIRLLPPPWSATVGAKCYSEFSCTVVTPLIKFPPGSNLLGPPLPANIIATFGRVSTAPSPAAVFTYNTLNPVLASIGWFVPGGPPVPGLAIVQLNGNAPPGGAVVNLQSSDPTVVVPTSVTVQGTSETFPVTILPSATAKRATVTARYSSSSVSMDVPVPALPPLSISPDSVALRSFQSATLAVILNTPPTADAIVTLTTSDSAILKVPPSVTILAGQYSASFAVGSLFRGAPNATAGADVTAAYKGMSATARISLTQQAPCSQPPTCPTGYHVDANSCTCVKGPPPPPR